MRFQGSHIPGQLFRMINRGQGRIRMLLQCRDIRGLLPTTSTQSHANVVCLTVLRSDTKNDNTQEYTIEIWLCTEGSDASD